MASKSDANELFAYNPFKLQMINESTGDRVAIYRCGCFMLISDTPLIRHNRKVTSVKILKVSRQFEIND